MTKTKKTFIIEARHPDTSALLGFISWKSGIIEFANFGAQLRKSILKLGSTTKRTNEAMAGRHGDGFKAGTLVMKCEGYNVRGFASSSYWKFFFKADEEEPDENELYCNISPMSAKKLAADKEKFRKRVAQRAKRELKANIWEDVSIKIGRLLGEGKLVEIGTHDHASAAGINLLLPLQQGLLVHLFLQANSYYS